MHTHPCPSCGYCPTCGRSAAPRVRPRPIWITPNAYPGTLKPWQYQNTSAVQC